MSDEDKARSLEYTPAWAIAGVCFVIVVISIIIEYIIHVIGKWLLKKHKSALYEALEKIKAELMILGFISLLLTVGQGTISRICIPESVGETWHPCKKKGTTTKYQPKSDELSSEVIDRKLLSDYLYSEATPRRILAGGSEDKCMEQGKVALVSTSGIHQLHIFIFVLAVFHVVFCIITMSLGRAKMRRWKAWEKETRTIEYQASHDPDRIRFTRETTFGRRHMNSWSRSPILIWIVCFFRQFFRSVLKVDYLTLRHGFIMAHLAAQSANKFDFRNYVKRSLDEDFKVVVGISPIIWFFAVLFLLLNTEGWYAHLWLPFIPLIIILLVGTKLQVIVTKMGLRILDKGAVVKGVPIVKPTDELFWFNRPRLILFLIHFVLFQNAFQLAFFSWSALSFGRGSCLHEHKEGVTIRIAMGVFTQFLCSYVTLPLYALVTQMGTTMKPTVFNGRVATALKNWHHTARKHIKQNQRSATVTPTSSMPSSPTNGMSPVHLLRKYRGEGGSEPPSPKLSNSENRHWQNEGSVSPSHLRDHGQGEQAQDTQEIIPIQHESGSSFFEQHKIDIGLGLKDFSFDNGLKGERKDRQN